MSDDLGFKVLAAIDADVLDLKGAYSLTSNAVFHRALAAANDHDKGELHLVTVVGSFAAPRDRDATVAHVSADLYKLATDEVAALAKKHPPLRIAGVYTHVLSGSPAQEIVWLAASIGADLVVVGSHGRHGLKRLLLGSVAEHVVRNCGCPVLVERDKLHDDTWVTPEIEPPCRQCVDARFASGGKQKWCDRHLEHHERAHTYSDGGDTALQGAGPWGFSN